MALRTCNQKAINDKMVAKLSGLGIAFHIFLCAGSILLIFSKNIYIPTRIESYIVYRPKRFRNIAITDFERLDVYNNT